jgi:hypothetical protein
MALGSDWSPSGSKSLLGELKTAKVVADRTGAFTSQEVVAMATREAAGILGWANVVGTLEAGKRADLIVIAGATGDPFDHLIEAAEEDLCLVVINGVPRLGTNALFARLGVTGEALKVGSSTRRVFLTQETQDPDVAKVSLAAARAQLSDALARLPELARALEAPAAQPRFALEAVERPVWRLALDELEDSGASLRPRLPLGGLGPRTGARPLAGAGTAPLSSIVEPLVLDPLTVVDDADFLESINHQLNLPAWAKEGLAQLY